jgi:hypothetical protein
MEQKTKHNCGGPKFGKLVDGCPRCEELKSGAKPRSWGSSYNYQMRVGRGPAWEAFKAALKSHSCLASNCGPVCTAFDS